VPRRGTPLAGVWGQRPIAPQAQPRKANKNAQLNSFAKQNGNKEIADFHAREMRNGRNPTERE
jgi:hypothetical protein